MPPTNDSNDWGEWKQVVFKNQERHEKSIEALGEKIDRMKDFIIGLMAGVIIEGIFLAIQVFHK